MPREQINHPVVNTLHVGWDKGEGCATVTIQVDRGRTGENHSVDLSRAEVRDLIRVLEGIDGGRISIATTSLVIDGREIGRAVHEPRGFDA